MGTEPSYLVSTFPFPSRTLTCFCFCFLFYILVINIVAVMGNEFSCPLPLPFPCPFFTPACPPSKSKLISSVTSFFFFHRFLPDADVCLLPGHLSFPHLLLFFPLLFPPNTTFLISVFLTPYLVSLFASLPVTSPFFTFSFSSFLPLRPALVFGNSSEGK